MYTEPRISSEDPADLTTAGEPPAMVAFDIDGVILRGGSLLPGASRAIDDVFARGLLLRFVTNNSTRHRSEVAAKLRGLGLPVQADMVLTSAVATAAWLAERLDPGARVLVVGGGGLLRELAEVGLDPVLARDPAAAPARARGSAANPAQAEGTLPEPEAADESPSAVVPAAVVVGLDVDFDYQTLATAQAALLSGALFVATNTDATFPVEGRLLPGGGAIVAAVATASGREPVVMGKPESGLADALVVEAGGRAGAILFVGDKLNTDIEMASRAGMRSALVLTGVTKRSELQTQGALQPDFVLETLEELPSLLDRLSAGPVLR
ncbi:MAG: HAD-IIA family hydrolase [Thermoleophilia bacterium]